MALPKKWTDKWTNLDQARIEGEARLEELEKIIEANLSSFVAVGRAIAEIKARRIYNLIAPSFEQYMVQRWEGKISRRVADSAAKGFLVSESVGAKKQLSRRAVTSLNRLPTTNLQVSAHAKAVERAVADGREEPTAADYEQSVQEVATSPPEELKPIDEIHLAAQPFREIANRINALKRDIGRLAETHFGVELQRAISAINGQLVTVSESVRLARPYCLCVFCRGDSDGCKCCRGRKLKWISYALYRNATKGQQELVTEHS